MESTENTQKADGYESSQPKGQLHPQTVIDLLAYHAGNDIDTDEMRELVLVVGKAQTGKSVLINTLCGVKFDYDDDDDDDGALKPLTELVTPVGDAKKGNFDCTVFPKVHFSKMLDGYIMDTPGYLGMDDLDLKVTKEQAIRLGVQQASRVKIVFLVNYKDLDGIQELSKVFVNILGNLCIRDTTKTPIYFLVNRFDPSDGLAKKYYKLPDGEKKNDFTVKTIQKYLVKASDVLEEQINRLNDRLTTRRDELINSGLSEDDADQQLQNDANFHEMIKTSATCDRLKNSLENNFWGYFDPTNSYFVEETVRMIRKAHSVDPDIFDFNMYQNEWIIAKRLLEEKLFEYKKWLVASKLNNLYPETFFDRSNIILDEFNVGRRNDLTDLKNKENIDVLTDKYTHDIGLQIKNTEKEIGEMSEEATKLAQERKDMENTKVTLCTYQWDKAGSFSDYGNYTVIYGLSKKQGYPVDIPITDRTIEISEPTYEYTDTYEPENALSITEFYSVSTGNKVGAIAKSVAIGAVLGSYYKYRQYAEEIKKQACKGTVIFYGRKSDKEWAAYAEKGRKICALNKEIANKKSELEKLRGTNANSIEKKIQSSINANKKQKDDLSSLHKDITNRIESFPDVEQCKYIGNDGKISLADVLYTKRMEYIYHLCKVLTTKTEITENIKTFIAMYDELQELEKQPDVVTPTLENLPKLCTEMRIELSKCNETSSQLPPRQPKNPRDAQSAQRQSQKEGLMATFVRKSIMLGKSLL